MTQFEYKVVPAPSRGEKVKGVKEAEMRFAHTVEGVLNTMARDGWEFVRAEMLPSEERSGLARSSKEWRNLLIFRRARPAAGDSPDLVPMMAPSEPPVPAKTGPRIRTPMPRKGDADGRTPPRRVGPPFDPEENDGLPPRPVVARPDPMADSPRDTAQPDEPAAGDDDGFDVRSVDDAAEAGPFRSLRERS